MNSFTVLINMNNTEIIRVRFMYYLIEQRIIETFNEWLKICQKPHTQFHVDERIKNETLRDDLYEQKRFLKAKLSGLYEKEFVYANYN